MPGSLQRRLRTVGLAAQNALEIMRYGRLSATPHGAPHDVVHQAEHYRLRRYIRPPAGTDAITPMPLVLVPPLMVTAEVYDMAPDVSAVRALLGRGVDVWLVDFGAPEREQGGMARTLDDHVRAIDDALSRVIAATGRDAHLCGYSQGGMFAYQVAAYRGSRGLASLITFGSPVDIHRNIPRLDDALAEPLFAGLRAIIARPLERIEGLPGKVTSTGFKVLSARKELRQLVDFVGKLHDRQALEQREGRRLFLGGQGFVAWPGPALRTFVDDIIVENRMLSGGFVIDGRTLSLTDIRCPVLYFAGLRDGMARPAAVRGIRKAAPHAEVHEVLVKAGHFGLVVGSTALEITWPAVIDWLRWRERLGPRPASLEPPRTARDHDAHDAHDAHEDRELTLAGARFDVELFYDVIAGGARTLWNRLGNAARELNGTMHDLRVQVPHLSRLRAIAPDTVISAGKMLAEQAAAIPDKTFFLWKGRAFSYADANRRVDSVVRGLIACGVRPGQRVGVLMASRPSYLSIITALNRLGAIAVLISPDTKGGALPHAMNAGDVTALVTDPDNARRARAASPADQASFIPAFIPILVLGGGPARRIADAHGGIIDMETIDPAAVELPAWYAPDAGRASDLAMIIFSTGRTGAPRASYISNHRWAFSAFGAAAAATLTPRDTVYSSLPLHHAAGSLVAAGSALVGGARLALAMPFSPDTFWDQVRRYGATVVFYAGEMCRPLVDAPAHAADSSHPVRLLAGSGMRVDVWRRLIERFGPVGVLEFYASTEGSAVLANASGQKIGSLGRPIPGSAELAVVGHDPITGAFETDERGRLVRCGADRPGMLLSRMDDSHPGRHIAQGARASQIRRDVFATGDTWLVTGDVVRRDRDGDYWFVDRASDMVVVDGRAVATPAIEDALYGLDDVELAVVYGVEVDGQTVLVASVITRRRGVLDAELLTVQARLLAPEERPRLVRCVDSVPMTEGHRPQKSLLRQQGMSPGDRVLCYDAAAERYQAR
jgi:putative long chain acyl-CoA synthase